MYVPSFNACMYHDQSILTITSHHENVNTIQCNGKKMHIGRIKGFYFSVAHPRPKKIEIERLKTLKKSKTDVSDTSKV